MAESGTIYDALIRVSLADSDAVGELRLIVEQLNAAMRGLDLPGVEVGQKLTSGIGGSLREIDAQIGQMKGLLGSVTAELGKMQVASARLFEHGAVPTAAMDDQRRAYRAAAADLQALIDRTIELRAVQQQGIAGAGRSRPVDPIVQLEQEANAAAAAHREPAAATPVATPSSRPGYSVIDPHAPEEIARREETLARRLEAAGLAAQQLEEALRSQGISAARARELSGTGKEAKEKFPGAEAEGDIRAQIAAATPEGGHTPVEAAQGRQVTALERLNVALETEYGSESKRATAVAAAVTGFVTADMRLEAAIDKEAAAHEKAAAEKERLANLVPIDTSGIDSTKSAAVQQRQLDLATAEAKQQQLAKVKDGTVTEAEIQAARIKVLRAQEQLALATERESKAAAAGSGSGGGGFMGGFMGGHGGSGGGSDLMTQAGFALKYYAFYKVFEMGFKLVESVKTQTEEYSLAVNQLSIAMGTNYETASKMADSYAAIGQNLATAPSVAINAGAQFSRFFQDKSGDSGTVGAQLGSTIQLLEGRSAKDGEEQQLVQQRLADLGAIAQNYGLGAQGASNLYDASTLIAQHYGRQYGGDLLSGTAQIADLLKESGFSPEQGLALVGSVQQYTGTTSDLAAGDLKRFLGRSGQNSFQDIFAQYQVDTNQDLHGELAQLGEKFKGLNENQRSQVISKLGGGRAGAAVVAAITDIPAQDAAAAAGADGVGAAAEQGYKKLDTFAGKMEQISATWKTLSKDIGESDLAAPFGLALAAIDPLLRVVDGLVKSFSDLPAILQAAAAGFALFRFAGVSGVTSGLNAIANIGKGGKEEAKDSALTSATNAETQAQAALTEATTTATAALEGQAAAMGAAGRHRGTAEMVDDSALVANQVPGRHRVAAADAESAQAATGAAAAQERLATTQMTAAEAAHAAAVAQQEVALAEERFFMVAGTSAEAAAAASLAQAEAAAMAATATAEQAAAATALVGAEAEAITALEAQAVANEAVAATAAEAAGASRLGALTTSVAGLGTAATGALAKVGPLLLLLAGAVAFGDADKQGKADVSNGAAAKKAMDDFNNATTPEAKQAAADEVKKALAGVKSTIHDSTWYGDLLLQGQAGLNFDDKYAHSWDDSPAKQRGVVRNQLQATLDEHSTDLRAARAADAAAQRAAEAKKEDGTLTATDIFGPDYTSIDRGVRRLDTLRLSATKSAKILTELLKNVPNTELPDLLTPGTGAKGLPDELKRLNTVVGRESDPVAKQADMAKIQQITALASQRAAASGSDQQDSAAQAADDATKALDAVVLKNLQMRVAKLSAEGGGKGGTRAQITALMTQAVMTFGKNGDIDSMIALLNSADASFLGSVRANFRAQVQILKDQIAALQEAAKEVSKFATSIATFVGPLAPGEGKDILGKQIAGKQKKLSDFEKALDALGKAEPFSTPSGSATKPLDDAELARIQSTETPGDAISQARVNLQVAQYQLGKAAQGTKEYWDAIKAVKDAEYGLSQAELAGANAAIMAGATSGDPVSQANAALAVANANLAAAVGSTEKANAQKAVNDAAYSKLQADTAAQVAQIQGSAIIADPVSQATAALAAAKVQLDASVGSTAYWNQLKQYRQAQYDLAQAERDAANTADLLGIDITDPVAQAREKVRAATRQLNADRKRGAGKDVINADLLNVRETTSAAEKAQFDQKFSDEQTNYNLNRISLSSYMSYLQSQHDYLTAVKHKTRDQVDELNQVDQALKSLTDSMDGQFNLGNIKVPTPYEVRRSMAGGSPTASTQNVTITINGSDLNAVRGVMGEYLGQGVMQTTGTSTRKV